MSEKRIVIEGMTISYEGYFNAKELYQLIEKWTAERGYDKKDVLHQVKVKEDGRYIDLDLRPNRNLTEDFKIIIQIKVTLKKVTDVEIKKDDKTIKTNHGNVKIVLNGIVNTDTEKDMHSKPLVIFFKTIKDKFIFKEHTKDHDQILKNDVQRLRNEISAYLNINKYTTEK